MSIYKRGQIYWYKFTFNSVAIRESTRQTNQHIARQMEAAHRSSLAKGDTDLNPGQKHPLHPRLGSTTIALVSGQSCGIHPSPAFDWTR